MTKQCLSVLIGVYIAISASAQCNYTVELGNAQNACSGANVTLNAAVSGASGSVSYVWQLIGGGAVGSNNSTYSFTISSANDGAYVVTTTVGTCTAVTDTVNINMYQGSPGAISGSLLLCTGANPPIFSSTSAASGVGANSIVYQWQSSTNNITWNNISSANNESYDSGPIANTLIYFRRVATFSYAGGNTCQAISNVITLQEVSAVIDINNTINQCVVAGTNLVLNTTFTSTPNNLNQTYSWTGPNGFSSSTLSPTISNYSANVSGTYTVSTTLPNVYNSSNNGQCTVQDIITLNLQPSISNYSISSPTCVGSNTNITGFSPQAGVSYAWHPANNSNITFSGGSTSSPVINFGTNASGLYQVYVVATAGSGSNTCTVQSATQTINVPNLSIINPDAYFPGTSNYLDPPTIYNNLVTYKICASNGVSSISLENIIPSTNNNASIYYLQWGNSPQVIFNNVITQPISIGNNPFTISATYNGCQVSTNYNIYVGSNPYVGCGVGSSTNLCPGQGVVANITPINAQGQQNSPGTTYDLYFSNNPNSLFQTFTDLTSTTDANQYFFNQNSCGPGTSNNCYPNQPNVYYAYVVATNVCSSSCAIAPAITINGKPDANFTVSQEFICPNSTITLTNTGTNGSTISGNPTSGYTCNNTTKIKYLITPNTGFSVFSGDLGGNSGNFNSWTGTNSVVLNFTTAGTYNIVQYAQSNNCGLDSIVKTICVINPPVCSFSLNTNTGCSPLPISSTNTTIAPTCSGVNVPMAYSWSITNPVNGTSAISNSNSVNPNFTFTNNGTVPLNFTVQLTSTPLNPVTNQPLSCFTTCTQTVTVNPRPVMTSINTATICSGTALNIPLTSNITSSFSWIATSNTFISGESLTLQNTNIINDNLANLSSTSQQLIYTVTPTSSIGCVGIPQTVTITLNSVTPGIIAGNQTICVNGNPNVFSVTTAATGSGTVAYQWQSSTDNITWNTIGSATAATYDPPAPASVTTYYRRIVTYTLNGLACSETSNVLTVTVNSIMPGTIAANQTICSGGDPAALSFSAAATGSGTLSYQWQSSTTSVSAGFTNISGATAATFDPLVGISIATFYQLITTSTLNTIGCPANSNPISITINTISPGVISASQTICSGGDPTAFVVNTAASGNGNLSYQWQSSSDNVVWTNIATETNIAYDPPSSSTTIYYRRIVTSTLNTIQCSAISNVVIVTVLPDPSIVTEPLATQSICVGAIIPSSLNVTFTNGTGNATYQWYASGTPNTAISGENSSNFLPSVFNTAGTYNYFVTVSMNGVGCDVATSQQATIVVLADPTVTAPASAAYCQNASPVAPLSIAVTGGLGTISYQWYSNTSNLSSNGTLIPQATLATFTPPVSSVGTMYYYCIVSQTGVNCAVTSQIATIQTTLAPVVSAQPLANQTICLGGTASALTLSYSNGTGTPTYQWYSNTTNANFGGTSISGETTASYLPSGNSIGTTYYYCVISFTTGGCSVITSQTAAVIVNPDPIISTQPLATQTICVGGPITTPLSVSYSGGTGTVSYQWFVAATTNTSIAGATSVSYSPITFATAGTFNYLVELSMTGSGCNTVTSQQATIVVLADPTVTAPTSAAYCQNASPVAPLSVAVTGGIGTISYQWYSNTSNLSSNGTLIAQAINATFTPPVSSVGTIYYYCIVSQTGVNCAVTSQIATILTTLAPVVSAQPLANQTICLGGTAAILTLSYSNGTGTPTYQWYSNTANANFGGTSINGETTSSYSPSGNSIGTTYYYCVISFTTGGCSVITSQTAAVIVNPDPIISTQPLATQTICVGGPITTPLSVSYSGGTGTVSYQWFMAGTTNTSIAGATSVSYSPITFATAGTFNYLVELSMTGSGCNTVTSQQATIVVLADPTVTAPASAAYCQNASPVAPLSVAVTGGLGTISYQWYSNTSNLSSNGTLIAQAINATFTPPVSSVGTIYYYCIVSQTGVNCAVTSQIATILTTLAPVVSAQPLANQTICLGGTAAILTLSYSNGTGTPTYQWYSNTANANFGGTSINGETTSSYSPSGNSIGTTYYYCVISFTTGGCSVITSQTAAVIVNPDPIISTQPLATQTICQGTSIPVPMSVSYIGGAGGATYQWYTNNGTTLINNALFSSYTPGVINTPGTYSYHVVVTLSGNGCETAASQPAEIIVNPIPTVNPIPLQNFCNSLGSNEIVISGTIPGTNFNWNNSNPANGLTPNGVGNIPVFTATNTTGSTLVSTITASPSYTNAGVTCFGINQTFTITINPTPNLNLPGNVVVCNGAQNPAINFTGTATSFTWTNTTTSIGLSASGLGNIPSFINVNPLIDPVIATITAIPNYSVGTANCSGLGQTFTITVNPTPTVIASSNQVVCNGASISQINFIGTGTTYTWVNNNPSIGLSASGTGTINPFTAINTGLVPVSATITVTPIYTGNNVNCTGPSQSFTITINPTPAVVQPVNQVLCNNTASAAVVFSGNGTSYSWTNTTPSIGIPLSGSGNIASFTSINATNTPIVATITVVPDFVGGSASCAGISQSFVFTINPTPIVNVVSDQFLCNGSSTSAINFTGTGTGYAWTNSATSIGLVANGTGNIGAFTATNTSSALLTGSILITPQYAHAGLTCNGLSQTITISVSPTPNVVDPADVVVCNGAPSPIISFTGNGTSYSWTNNNPSIGLPVSGNGNIASFIANNPGTTPVVATLTVLPDYTIDGITCPGPTQTFTLTVNPTPTVSPLSNQTICNGSSAQAISFVGTGTSYAWTNSLISIGIGGNGIGTIPAFTGINTSSLPTIGNFSVTPQYLNAGLTCSGPQQTFSITVNPTPVVNDPPDLVVCNGTVIPITPFTGSGTYYSWTNSIPSIGLGAGANGSIPAFTGQNNSNSLQQVAQLAVTAYFDQGGALCAGNTQNFTFTVNPTTTLTDPVNQVVCNTTQTTAVNFVGTGTSYSWLNSNTLIGLAANGIGNIPAFTANNTTAVQDQATVVVTPIYSSLDGLSCPGTPQNFTYSINPSPIALPVADFAVCNGTTINVPLSANILSNFTWYADPNNAVSGDVNFPQPSLVVSNTLTNTSTAMQFITYHILPTSSPEGCLGLEATFVVQVVPDVEITSIATTEICSGAFVNVALTANIPASFVWLASDNPNVTGENTLSQTNASISDFLVNTTTQNQLVVYSIIPTSLAEGCIGDAQTVAVLVRPPLALLSEDTISICSDNIVNLTFQANASASFNWFANDNQLVQGESTSVQNSSTILDDLVNATNAIQQVDYTVVATSIINGCSSPIFNVTVFVNPLPVGNIPSVEICTGETTSIPLTASIPSLFSWAATSNPVVLGETIQVQNNATIVNTLLHNAVAAQVVNYTVTPVSTAFGCAGNPFTIPVTVHPLPIVSFNTTGSVTCNLIPVTFNNTSQGILDYAWNFGDNATSFDFAPAHTYPLLGPYTVTLVGTNPVTGCSNTFVQNVSLSESPEVDFIVSADEGCVVLDVTFADMVNDPNTTLLWNFGDGETSFQPNIVDHQYTDPGCYDVSLTVTNAAGCFITETQTEMVCVYAIPDALFTVSQDSMPTSEPVFELINLSTNAYTYLWDFGNFTTSTATNPIQTYNAAASEYVITLFAYNQFGCYDSMFLTVAVTEDLLYYVPNTFTPNGDGTNDIFLPVLTAGFDPTSYTLLIFNRWGEVLFESHDPAVGWDGQYKPMLRVGNAELKLNPCNYEEIMQDGTYTWKIQFTGLQNESAFEFVGHVNLLK